MSPHVKTKASQSLDSVPDDLLMSCVAKVSRMYYPTLSLVSKSFRSLIASPELYNARSLLGHKESCLYLCFSCCRSHRWFTLSRKPTSDISMKTKSRGYVLAAVPYPHSPPAYFSNLVEVRFWCEIGNITYCVSDRTITWSDNKASMGRRVLKGLEGLPKFPHCAHVILAYYNGKMVVLWDEDLSGTMPCGRYNQMILCAEIALERRQDGEIWGNVEWIDRVLRVDESCCFVEALIAT